MALNAHDAVIIVRFIHFFGYLFSLKKNFVRFSL